MNYQPTPTTLLQSRKARGVSLIELLVSMVIGLLLAMAGSAAYLYSKQSYNAVSETAQMEENGRFALNLLSRNIQSAGFVMLNPMAPAVQGALIDKIRGCDFGLVDGNTPADSADLGCRAATPAGERRSASISVFGDTDASDNAGAKFQGFDCVGNGALPVSVPSESGIPFVHHEVKSHFFISFTTSRTATGITTTGQLSCVADSTPSAGPVSYEVQPLIPGIEQLAVNYLMPSPVSTKSAQSTASATAVTTAGRWGEVMAVELCVLTKSIQPAGNETATQYTDCYGDAIAATSLESFRTFRTVVNLRNRTPL